jgi:membrane carboxypeptidase/penicillin-binding protein PbpC
MRAEVLSHLIAHQTIDSMAQLSSHRCYPQWADYKPLITNPIDNKRYIHNRLLPHELQKTMLQCYSFDANSTIYWLIDKEPPIVAQSGEKIYHYLSPAQHSLTCVDEGARAKQLSVFIEEH